MLQALLLSLFHISEMKKWIYISLFMNIMEGWCDISTRGSAVLRKEGQGGAKNN